MLSSDVILVYFSEYHVVLKKLIIDTITTILYVKKSKLEDFF